MIHVYVGPTLNRGEEPLLHAPGVRALPPARHGDLFDPAIAAGDTVVLIDGLYHQAPALRHKEILAALARGVRVIGAASIGALRAAELHAFGMTGVGAVFRSYVEGLVDGDDEVAVGQEPDAGLRALTWALVNAAHVLRLAEGEGLVSGRTASELLAHLRQVYYPQRTTAAVLAVFRRYGSRELASWFEERLRADRHFGNLKRLDALDAVRVALRPAAPGGFVPADAQWDTGYYRLWANRFASRRVDGTELPTAQRLAYQQVFDPHFPEVWQDHLDHLSLHPGDGGEGMPLAERMARLTGGQPAPPVHAVFRPRPDLRDDESVARLLRRETAADRLSITRYGALNEALRRSRPGFSPEAVRDDVTGTALCRLWGCRPERLDAYAAARGFGGGARAVDETKPFMAGLLQDQPDATAKEPAPDAA
ncbi:TfuA-like protein [Streptomyces sp. NPDC086023]|uniref:TfuA-like protein n=1 Tax=Streptomyces sp. NPDC086023 TaxID=3365746 RepID=UPI0037D81084